MSNAGRPRKPTALKLLEGDIHKKRMNMNEPKPRPIVPDPPKWLEEVKNGAVEV